MVQAARNRRSSAPAKYQAILTRSLSSCAGFALNRLTETKDVSIWMPHVHFARIPWHVGGWLGDFQPFCQTALVNGIYVIHPIGHPYALGGGFVTSGPNVIMRSLLPRPPCAFRHKKISHAPEQTPPKIGGPPQSQPFCQPSFSNQAKHCCISVTLRSGVIALAWMSFIAILARCGSARKESQLWMMELSDYLDKVTFKRTDLSSPTH